MGLFKQLLGICQTRPPADAECWTCVDDRVEILLDRAAELSDPGGAIRLEGSGLRQRLLVVHGQDGSFHAFPNRCTHIGHRRLDPVPGEAELRCCSVGRSRFDYTGGKLSGLARKPIQPLGVEVESGKLIIALS